MLIAQPASHGGHPGIDFTKTGCSDIVVGREDGSLEVYDIDETGAPQQVRVNGCRLHAILLSLRVDVATWTMDVAAYAIVSVFEAPLNACHCLAACTACGLQVLSVKLTESINALDGGYITTLNTQEVVLQTFTGKVRARQSKGTAAHMQHPSRPPAHAPLPNCQVLTCFPPGRCDSWDS